MEKGKFKKMLKLWYGVILRHKFLLAFSVFLLILSTFVNFLAGTYVTNKECGVVTDLILDYVPVYDWSFIFIYGYMAVIGLFFAYPLFFDVKKLHNTISQFSLLVMLRSFFILFTHLKTPIEAIPINFPSYFSTFTFENDLFFSGHTAVPFLGFLIFKNSRIRWVFLGLSILMGATTLLMHRHYSIDVFAAFFITYGSYKMGNYAFNKLEKKFGG